MLWINIITDGPPALALGLDRSPGVMTQQPRDPKSPLLDAPSLRFILVTGVVKALIGILLLALLPKFGYSFEATRSMVFLYASIGQLVFAYPARHIGVMPLQNRALHLAVILGIGLQPLTAYVLWLRTLLGLEAPDLAALIWIAGAVLLSWAVAEATSRLAGFHWKHNLAVDHRQRGAA